MALTMGTGPFARDPGGELNAELDSPGSVLYLEDSPRRVRVRLGGQTVADSRRVRLLHETGHLPVYYFPPENVRMELLEESDHSTHCPWKGEASYWSVVGNGERAENGVWAYPEPIEGAPGGLGGLMAFDWGAMDEWLEEDEVVEIHPRDPYHRVDVLRSSRHVRVSLEGELLADSGHPRILFETGLPPRYYLPREDVGAELLPSETHTGCPYKGTASYYSVELSGERHEDLIWTYPEPLPEVEPITGLLCFWNERTDLELDGEALERPITHWVTRGPHGLAGPPRR